jgi:probable rRNA maturation factor
VVLVNLDSITDQYGYVDYDYLDGVIEETLHHEKAVGSLYSIVLVGEEEIQNLNRDYRGIDAVTDVISFAFEDNGNVLPKGVRMLGDIYICIPRMQEQAKNYGHSEKRELSFLVVHGLLHLLGYDHMTKEDEQVMFRLQDEILAKLGILR